MSDANASTGRIKQEDQYDGTGVSQCLICFLPIRVPGGEPDALRCGQCGVVYHRACAKEWEVRCAQCRGEVSRWTRPSPPGLGVEVIELDGDEDGEGEEEA